MGKKSAPLVKKNPQQGADFFNNAAAEDMAPNMIEMFVANRLDGGANGHRGDGEEGDEEVKVTCVFDPRENADIKHKQIERQKVHDRVAAVTGGHKPCEEITASDVRNVKNLQTNVRTTGTSHCRPCQVPSSELWRCSIDHRCQLYTSHCALHTHFKLCKMYSILIKS